MDLNEILFNLNDENEEQIKTLRKIITLSCCTSENWSALASKLEDLIKQNHLIGKESALLASQALFSLYTNFDTDNVSSHLCRLLSSPGTNETCKLTVAFGFLQTKTKKPIKNENEIFTFIFKIIQPHCMSYTNHTYFAEKVLLQWLVSTKKTTFWSNNSEIGKSLEAIIFSNWQNSIQDVAKCNSSKVFSLYLKIMEEKYEGFLEFLLKKCVLELSWNHVIKYKILAEVCSLLPDGFELSQDVRWCLIEKLLDAVMVCHLQKASSHVFEILLVKKIVKFGEFIRILEERVQKWSEENDDEAIFNVYKYILQRIFQLSETSNKQSMLNEMSPQGNTLYDTYIKLLQYENKRYDQTNHFFTETSSHCLKSDYQKAAHLSLLPKSNLPENVIFNSVVSIVVSLANTESLYLRNELVRNMDVLFNRVSKLEKNQQKILYDFFYHCFGIASTYQRKILGLAVYKNACRRGSDFLTFNQGHNDVCKNDLLNDDEEVGIKSGIRNRLFRLVLDPASDVRKMATELLVEQFLDEPLTAFEIELVKEKARERSNSLNFYEAETAAILIKLLYEWKGIDEDLRFWICEARQQLMEVKTDICKAVCNSKPFYGILIVILENFYGAFKSSDEAQLKLVLDLLEDAVQFFTETLLKPVESSEYASTVAGIGVAVQEIIENGTESDLNMSTEHQNIFTCIWRSLKATSEIAAAVAIKSEDDENIDRSCRIIFSILLKCYHKGAIKAAGLSLSRVCRHFCETGKITKKKNPIENQLKYLCDLETSNDEEAGLTIAFHRIVSSDVRPTRPFLHYAMETLLKFLDAKLKSMNIHSSDELALPCVLQLNFLQTLIEDKQLLSAITIYLEDVCFVCLQFMRAKDFLIRNAGMQLFGAIIPRLTGQIADTNSDFGYGYSVCHFVSHYPRLSEHVLQTLESCSRSIQTRAINLEDSSNLSNIMILLSKLFVGGCDLTDSQTQNYIARVHLAVQNLLRCHVSYVRLLAAKVFVAFTGTPRVVQELVRLARKLPGLTEENELHGILLAFTYLKEKIKTENKHFEQTFERKYELVQLVRFWSRRCRQLNLMQRPCFVVETLLLKNPEILWMLGYLQQTDNKSLKREELLDLLLPEKFAAFAGFQEFVTELMKMFCKHDSWCDLGFIELILSSPNHNYAIAFFKFSHNSKLDEAVAKLNRVIDSIIEHHKTDCKNVSLYELLQPSVIKTVAEYKLFERVWNNKQTKKGNNYCFTGLQFSETDENRLIKESLLIKLSHQVFQNVLSSSFDNGYDKLCDFYRKLYADFVYTGYSLSKKLEFDLYPYVLMICRDQAPDVRDTFRDVSEQFILQHEKQNVYRFCPRLKFEIIKNMKNVSEGEYWSRCKKLLKLVETELYKNCRDDNVVTCYHDDIELLSFVNHLIDNKRDESLDTNLQNCTLKDAKHFRSLKDSIETTDSIYVFQVHDYVSNKLTRVINLSIHDCN